MTSIKTAWLSRLALVALVAVIGVLFAFKPFTVNSAEEGKLRSTIYYYNDPSTSFTDMQVPGKWAQTQSSTYECGGEDQVPCSISVPDNTNLSNYLSEFTDLEELIEASSGNRKVKP